MTMWNNYSEGWWFFDTDRERERVWLGRRRPLIDSIKFADCSEIPTKQQENVSPNTLYRNLGGAHGLLVANACINLT